MGIIVLPVAMLLTGAQHCIIILFHIANVLIHAPRIIAGLCVILGLVIHIFTFGKEGAMSAAMRHRHWEELIELDGEIKNNKMHLEWNVTVLRNDEGEKLRIRDRSNPVVRLGANLWKRDNKDTDEMGSGLKGSMRPSL